MAALDAPPAVLQAVGRYQLVRDRPLLGRGRFGSVYLYRDLWDDGQHVAVKRIALTGWPLEDRQLLSIILERELVIHHALNHPNIVKMRDVILEPNHLNIVMECVEGQNLFMHLKALPAKYSEDDARVLFQQLIVALDYLHAKGAAHRDIKLENTLLQTMLGGPTLKLADFGFGRIGLQAGTKGIGSPRYLAPEVIPPLRPAAAAAAAATAAAAAATATAAAAAAYHPAGAAQAANGHEQAATYDARQVDVWTAGVLLYAILHGDYPFPEPDMPEIIWLEKLAGGPKWDENVMLSHGCRDLLLRLLQYDPAQRITVGDILQHEWFMVQLNPDLLVLKEQHMSLPSPCALSTVGMQGVIRQLKQRLLRP